MTLSTKNLFGYTIEKLKQNIITSRIPETLNIQDYDQNFAEEICQLMFKYCDSNLELYDQAITDFMDLSKEFIQLQVELEETGKQHFSSHEEVSKEIYDNPEVMENRYLKGILLSQAFWINQHKTLNFFIENFCLNNNNEGKVLEVPVGTGIFISEFMKQNICWDVEGFDISKSAVDFSKKLLRIPAINHQGSINISKEDVFLLSEEKKFERIICGLLLENFENPRDLLRKLQNLLTEDGKLFLTTTAWTSGVDHVYLFKSVQEIRDMLKDYFEIEKEMTLNIFPGKNPEEEKTAANYVCILKHKV